MGNPIVVTETMQMPPDLPLGTYLESDGLVVAEAENGQVLSGTAHAWLTSTAISGYTGTAYLHALPDIDQFYPTDTITDSPQVEYLVNFTTPDTYTVWIRGYADNADADAVNAGLDNDVTPVTGFAPETWDWASGFEELVIETSGSLGTGIAILPDKEFDVE
jgi:hypothetical protein